MNKTEFDTFAQGYDAAMSNPLKKATGAEQDDFLRPKTELLLHNLGIPDKSLRVLDFGCGTGDMLRLLQEKQPAWSLSGTDISEGMLAVARTKFAERSIQKLELFPAKQLPDKDPFDLVYASCVFHHIPPAEWGNVVGQIRACLKPRGSCMIFEHNPWNPFTQLIVRTSPIDENAILLSSRTLKRVLKSAGFIQPKIQYFLFFPPKLRTLRRMEICLRKIPLGAQYCIRAVAG